MKELSKKIIEAGLVPKHTLQMMEKWKMLDPSDVHAVPSKEELESRTKEQLTSFAEEIAGLLEDTALPECRETDLMLDHFFQAHAEDTVAVIESGPQRLRIDGLKSVLTRDGHRVLRRKGMEKYIEVAARPGNGLIVGEREYTIQNVEVRYIGDVPEFYSCAVLEIPNAQV